MKRIIALLLLLSLMFAGTACGSKDDGEITADTDNTIKPQISQMESICELAVMDCYYHNVAKFNEEDVEGFLWWTKDKHFWIEYSGIVTLGIDVSKVNIAFEENEITVTLPDATVQSCKVDSSTLTDDSFIVDPNSADIDAEDESAAFKTAQENLREVASNDTTLLAEAKHRAQSLLNEYISNINDASGNKYTIHFK